MGKRRKKKRKKKKRKGSTGVMIDLLCSMRPFLVSWVKLVEMRPFRKSCH
jgi:hypothetical protein